nr:unnamed protein product [Callosobruchus chinensis]
MLKLQLLEVVKQQKAEYDKYRIVEMAKVQNKTDVTFFFDQHNKTFKASDMKELFVKAMQRIILKNGKNVSRMYKKRWVFKRGSWTTLLKARFSQLSLTLMTMKVQPHQLSIPNLFSFGVNSNHVKAA